MRTLRGIERELRCAGVPAWHDGDAVSSLPEDTICPFRVWFLDLRKAGRTRRVMCVWVMYEGRAEAFAGKRARAGIERIIELCGVHHGNGTEGD